MKYNIKDLKELFSFQLTDFEVPDVEEEDEHLEEDQETGESVSFRSQENFQKPGVRHF